jgi:hypothetical protein
MKLSEKMLNLLSGAVMALGIALILASLTKALPERKASFSGNAPAAAAFICGDCFDTSYMCDCGGWSLNRTCCDNCCYHYTGVCKRCYFEVGTCNCGSPGDCSCSSTRFDRKGWRA